MEIKSVKNKILDKLNIERVMTEEEVKEELALIRSKKVVMGLSVGCSTLAIINYSEMVDGIAFRLINTIKSYMTSNTMFLNGLLVPNWFMFILYFSMVILMYCAYINNLNKAKKSK